MGTKHRPYYSKPKTRAPATNYRIEANRALPKRKCTEWPACPSSDECGMAHPGRNDDPLKWPSLRDRTHAPSLPEKKAWIAQSAAKPQNYAQLRNVELEATIEQLDLETANKKSSATPHGGTYPECRPACCRNSSRSLALLKWNLPRKAIGPGEKRSRNAVCQYYPYCIRGRSCFYLHPHEAQNGRNIDSAAAGGIGMIRKIRERQFMVHAQILADRKNRKKYTSQQKRSKRARQTWATVTQPAKPPVMAAAKVTCAIPFATSGGFRTAFLSTNDGEPIPAAVADSSLGQTFLQIQLAGELSQTEALQALEANGDTNPEWYGEEVSLEEETSAFGQSCR